MDTNPIPTPDTGGDCPPAARVTSTVAMAHVADVDRANRFYALLGFSCESRFSGTDGVTSWCDLASGTARLFLARASAPVVAGQQAILFYMYAADVAALRAHLLARGVPDGGAPPGEGDSTVPDGDVGPRVFEIVERFYMPLGELRIHDPDGYVVLVGQLG